MKSIVFDLDDTICYPNHEYKDTQRKYSEALPNQPIIDKIIDLKGKGYYIIISSARRMLTHSGDVSKIIQDVGEVTEQWLDRHGVPYDELQFGKPYASSYYVDDKALNLEDFLKKDFT